MHIQIDQSGKVEDTARNTVVAFANGKSKSVLITGKEKRELERFFREKGKGNIFMFKTFAILTFLLVRKDLSKIERIVIDTEYTGQEALIKTLLMQEIYKIIPCFEKDKISFNQIGRKVRAHQIAIDTFRGKRKSDLVVKAMDVIKVITKIK